MLTYLHVKNLALIDEAEVEFGPGLNILTGETGAGKSILMGSVNLALGQKMSREMLRDEEKPALVELIFQVDNPRCVERLKEKEISVEEGQIIISRKLTGNRSISRLNGEVCTAAQDIRDSESRQRRYEYHGDAADDPRLGERDHNAGQHSFRRCSQISGRLDHIFL